MDKAKQEERLILRLAILRPASIAEIKRTIPNSIDQAQLEKLCAQLKDSRNEQEAKKIFDRLFPTLSPYARGMVRELLLD